MYSASLGDIIYNYATKQKNLIIFIDPEIIRKRKMDVLTSLAYNLKTKCFVLYPGTTATAHAATIFREMGHKIVHVGDEKFKDGEKIALQINNDETISIRRVAGN